MIEEDTIAMHQDSKLKKTKWNITIQKRRWEKIELHSRIV